MPELPVDPKTAEPADDHIPLWLAGVVVVLLIGVIGVGVYVIDTVLDGRSRTDAAAADVTRLELETAAAPEDADAHLELATAYRRAGRLEDAQRHYEVVLSSEPTNAAGLYNLALVLEDQGLESASLARLESLMRAHPTHVLGAKALANSYISAGRMADIARIMEPVVAAHPELADLQILTARSFEALGDMEQARVHYQAALRQLPENREATEGLARTEGDER